MKNQSKVQFLALTCQEKLQLIRKMKDWVASLISQEVIIGRNLKTLKEGKMGRLNLNDLMRTGGMVRLIKMGPVLTM